MNAVINIIKQQLSEAQSGKTEQIMRHKAVQLEHQNMMLSIDREIKRMREVLAEEVTKEKENKRRRLAAAKCEFEE